MSKTIIISNRLPVKIERSQSGELEYIPSAGGLATGLSSIYKQEGNVWLGWPGNFFGYDEEKTITKELESRNMSPVFLNRNQKKLYYEGFSNELLWPNFHYFNEYTVYSEDYWDAYLEVNKLFLEKTLALAEEGDTIWVHDYHLLLLPNLIREKLPKAKIGFFLHIPFPSFEVFRLIPWRRELLDGMLGADLIGMHTYDDMRHFMSAVSRIAYLSPKHGQVYVGSRSIEVDSFPMGIDFDKYSRSAASPATLSKEVEFRTSLGNQKIMLSIDRLDYSKGIPNRLRAFDRFLNENPEYCEKISLLMVVVPSRDKVSKYQHLKEEVDLLVGRINGRHGTVNWTPIHYFYRSFNLTELSAFYRLADVALVTPMRDGMNLVAKEYVASRLDNSGVLILSEMAGASKELSDAIIINPNNQKQIVEGILQALNMSLEEQQRHMKVMAELLQKYNLDHWVNLFLERLDRHMEKNANMATKPLGKDDKDKIIEHYKKSKKRQLFLDYDGTLQFFVSDPSRAMPDKELLEILADLASDEKNDLVVVSGRDKNTLGEWLSDLPITLIAEHGVFTRKQGEDWEKRAQLTEDWKTEIRNVLEDNVSRTPGSFIEEKSFGLAWHYRKVDDSFGQQRAREIISHLKYMTRDRSLSVLEGHKVVEVKDELINKGRAASDLVLKGKDNFILAIGDDHTDEDTFEAMPPHSYTVKVGSLNTSAHYYIDDVDEVRNLLRKMVKA